MPRIVHGEGIHAGSAAEPLSTPTPRCSSSQATGQLPPGASTSGTPTIDLVVDEDRAGPRERPHLARRPAEARA